MQPPGRVLPVVFTLCAAGDFAIAARPFDVWTMLAFGIIGFVLRQMKYPMAPLVLGTLPDKSLRRGLILSEGSVEPFLTRPISATLAAMTLFSVLALLVSVLRIFWNRRTR